MPSPRGLPLPQNTGKGHSHLLVPKIWYTLLIAPMSYTDLKGLPFLSRFSIVVLFDVARNMWNFRKKVINTAIRQSTM